MIDRAAEPNGDPQNRCSLATAAIVAGSIALSAAFVFITSWRSISVDRHAKAVDRAYWQGFGDCLSEIGNLIERGVLVPVDASHSAPGTSEEGASCVDSD